MWIFFAVASALCLGFYDIFKKLSVRGNDVLMVLMLNTVFGALYILPFLIAQIWTSGSEIACSPMGHAMILLKSLIVLGSWMLGYFAIKHLPLTIQGPINASRPVLVLTGAVIIFGESLNTLQWCGILLGFFSLFLSSRLGGQEGFSVRNSKWIWMSIGATMLGAVSALYDKYLLRLYSPIEVQGWYAIYQCAVMITVISIMRCKQNRASDPFRWRWTIPCIALFLTIADMAYFYALSQPEALVAVTSMIRRGSVLVSFAYGAIILRERNLKAKIIDLAVLLLGLILLVIGSA